jgi:putative flippase GtrA
MDALDHSVILVILISNNAVATELKICHLLPLFWQFVGYLVCSGTAAAINFFAAFISATGVALTSGVDYRFAIAGYILAMLVNFLLNRRYTFSSSERTRFERRRTFMVVALSGLALTSFLAGFAGET